LQETFINGRTSKNIALKEKEDLWEKIREVLGSQLQEVEKLLQDCIVARTAAMQNILEHIFSARGKRLRPILLLLCGSIGPLRSKTMIKAAAAVELIHTASLVHDDIIDKADVRRGKPSVNALWGNRAAVLAGDFLFARAFELIADCKNYELNRILTVTIGIMCEGEIEQIRFAFDAHLKKRQYLANIYRKTAALIEACCVIGGTLSGLKKTEVLKLKSYGKNLGMAFQITDDILDIAGEPLLTGKPVGSDLREGIITLPLIYVLEDPLWGQFLREMIKNRDFTPSKIEALCQPSCLDGPIKKALKLASQYLVAAREALETFKGAPEGEILDSLAVYLLERSG